MTCFRMHGPSNSAKDRGTRCNARTQFRRGILKMTCVTLSTKHNVLEAEFHRIIRSGICVADGILVLFAIPTAPDDDSIRLGITIPKKPVTQF